MSLWNRRVALLALAGTVLAMGCSNAPSTEEQLADASDVQVRAAELGGSYRLAVEAAQGAATNANVALLRFRVPAGTTFAAVMRRSDDSELDAFLSLYPAERQAGESDAAIATSKYDQAALPMAIEPDAMLVHRSDEEREFLLFASDVELDVRGQFQIDLVALQTELSPRYDLTLTDPGLRKLTSLLRDDEAQVAELTALGAVEEGDDGLLLAHPLALESLKARADLNGFVARNNDVRSLLYEAHSRAAMGDANPALASQIGSLCGELWSALRSEPHTLR